MKSAGELVALATKKGGKSCTTSDTFVSESTNIISDVKKNAGDSVNALQMNSLLPTIAIKQIELLWLSGQVQDRSMTQHQSWQSSISQ